MSLSVSDRVRSILDSSIVCDNHACMPLKAEADALPLLAVHRDAGFNLVSINVGMSDISLLEHLRVLSFMRQWIQQHGDEYRLVHSVEDVHRCKADGKLGITFDVEGMKPVQDDISFVQTFYELGVRWMLIAYNRNNEAGGGCLDEDCGLLPAGRAVIDEMERVGMVLCLSHTGERTAREALEYSRNPPIFSHSNPFSDQAHPRNIGDDLMRGCAAKGGVVGLNGFECFLGDGDNLVDSLLRQLRYAIDLIGPAHVGLGIDYCFEAEDFRQYARDNPHIYTPDASTSGMIAPEAILDIAEGLARTRLNDEEIGGILGGNWLRIASQVWK
jgi:membrane dipeptidase